MAERRARLAGCAWGGSAPCRLLRVRVEVATARAIGQRSSRVAGVQVRRPWLISETWASYIAQAEARPGSSHGRYQRPPSAGSGRSAGSHGERVDHGHERRPELNSRTTEAVFLPMPGIAASSRALQRRHRREELERVTAAVGRAARGARPECAAPSGSPGPRPNDIGQLRDGRASTAASRAGELRRPRPPSRRRDAARPTPLAMPARTDTRP